MAWYKHPVLVCIIACIIPSIGGFVGALITETGSGSWYEQLKKPSFNPPIWLFFPAWLILYITTGFASFRVWHKGGGFLGKARTPLIFFAIQLFLNWIWAPIFFGLQALSWALAEMLLLWMFVSITTVLFMRIDLLAGFIMVPYVAWITFASTVNYSLWHLNK